MNHKFTPVANNQEKYETYRLQMERFVRARDQGFHLEGIFILYVMLEDRLSAFLYYVGAVNKNRDKLTTNKKVKPDLSIILEPLGKKRHSVRNISTKSSIARQLLLFSQHEIIEPGSDKYRHRLCRQFNKLKSADEIIPLLDAIREWCQARNELVHALLNKRVDHQEEELKVLIEDGYQHCRHLDNYVKAFKRGNTIRKEFNIQ